LEADLGPENQKPVVGAEKMDRKPPPSSRYSIGRLKEKTGKVEKRGG
jgi:hypothetical protein